MEIDTLTVLNAAIFEQRGRSCFVDKINTLKYDHFIYEIISLSDFYVFFFFSFALFLFPFSVPMATPVRSGR